MNDEERYLFDLMGFLVVEEVLGKAELEELNVWIDRHDPWTVIVRMEGQRAEIGEGKSGEGKLHIGPVRQWAEPFRRLINHPRIMPYLAELLEKNFRLDHEYAIIMDPESGPLRLHGGGTPYRSDQSYHFHNGRIHNGLVTVSFALTDVNPGDGGFCAVPGSHKSNFEFPKDLVHQSKTGPWLVRVPLRAGSALIFTEALTHGTAPWRAKQQRRALLYKYSPGHQSWSRQHNVKVPEADWSEEQLWLQRPPYVPESLNTQGEGVYQEFLKHVSKRGSTTPRD